MRIVCPSCASQYEVEASAIPENGRDVQCAKCSEIWFQEPANTAPEEENPLPLEPEATPNPAPEPAPVDKQEQNSGKEPSLSQIYEDLRRQQQATDPETAEIYEDPNEIKDYERFAQKRAASAQEESAPAEPVAETPPSEPTPSAPVAEAPTEMEVPEVVQEPEPVQPETAPEPAAAAPAMFRSLRATRTAPTAPPEPTPEVVEQARRPIAPDVKNILQEEAEYSANQRNTSDPEPSQTADTPEPSVKPEVQQPSTQEVSGRETPSSDLQEQFDKIEAIRNEHTDAQDDSESVTLASAKSLRDVLASQAGSEVEEVEVVQDVEPVKPAPAKEPSLSELGFKRPEITPVVKKPEPMEEVVKDQEPQTDEMPTLAQTSAKSGKDVFTDIDKINSNLDIEEDDQESEADVEATEVEEDKGRGPFAKGFLLACFLCLLLFALYALGPSFASSVPAADGFVTGYRDSIDSGRMVLQDMYYGGGEPGFENLFNNLFAKS